MTTPRGTARHAFASACGIQTGAGCECMICGASPFDSAGPWRKALGVGFSDWDCCESPNAADLCAGCARLLGGRPGDDPPPPRTRSLAVVDGSLHVLSFDAMWQILTTPPQGITALSWAVSKQKHHLLYAEPCSPDRLRIGSDSRTIDYRPLRDRPLVDAVLGLRAADEKGKAWFTRDEITIGNYSTPKIARGANRWAELEAVVAPRRGDPVLDLIVAHAPATTVPTTTEDPMIDPIDEQAIGLLQDIAAGSAMRTADGLTFWSSLLRRRLTRHAGRPLAAFAARMMADLDVPPSSAGAQAIAARIEAASEEDAVQIMARLRERAPLLIALTFDRHKATTSARKTARAQLEILAP